MSFFSLWFHDFFFSQLNAGSCDRVIRVWELHTGSPVAVLTKHTGTVTAINFCPFLLNDDGSRFLASTSGDGTVSFWRYHYDEHGHTNFDAQPTRYHEKSRPGNAQMICASYSPVWIFRQNNLMPFFSLWFHDFFSQFHRGAYFSQWGLQIKVFEFTKWIHLMVQRGF